MNYKLPNVELDSLESTRKSIHSNSLQHLFEPVSVQIVEEKNNYDTIRDSNKPDHNSTESLSAGSENEPIKHHSFAKSPKSTSPGK